METIPLFDVVRDWTPALAPSTRVLCSDFTWRPVGDLETGDELIAYEDFTATPGLRRSMKIATVEARASVSRPSCRIRFTDGREVVASPTTQWLTDPHSWWIWAGNVTAGRKFRDLGNPWKTEQSWEVGWLSGVYDGEGWLSDRKGPNRKYGGGWFIGFCQNEGAVLDLAKRLVKERGYEVRERSPEPDRKIRKFMITGMYDCFRFLGECRPVRLIEKSRPWVEGATLMRSRGSARNRRYSLEVAEVSFLGDRDLIALSTSTNTVLAEGLFASLARKAPNRARKEPRRH